MTDTWECPVCEVSLTASDEETLEWGIEAHNRSHAALVGDFGEVIAGRTHHDPVEADVLCWLVGLYGPPGMRWFPATGGQVIVT